jgi:hypothetical protein
LRRARIRSCQPPQNVLDSSAIPDFLRFRD